MEMAVRAATPADLPGLRRVIGREPSDEQVGMAGGSRARAARFRALVMSDIATSGRLPRTIVAAAGTEVVGFLQSGAEGPGRVSLGLALGVVRIFGPLGVRGFLTRDRARSRVNIAAPEGAYHIAELHVLADRRNLGIGAALLAEAERIARAGGFAEMSLTTTTSNPARRLYERAGFEVTRVATDAEYRSITGIDGHVLMVKSLSAR